MAFAALEMPLTPYLLNEPGQRKINTKEHQETGFLYSAPCFRRGKAWLVIMQTRRLRPEGKLLCLHEPCDGQPIPSASICSVSLKYMFAVR
jgi:hypothetical protein